MPVILARKDYDGCLDHDEAEQPPVHLLRPFRSIRMDIHTAHPGVCNVRNQGPELLNSR